MGQRCGLGMIETLITKFKKQNPSKQIVVLFKAGSHFFDLNGPNSDTDYRGLYIDRFQDCFESSRKTHLIDYKTNETHGKNTKGDIDFTLFSMTTFFKLLKSGDFNMMELLFTPEDKIIYKTPLFDELVSYRENLLVNDISSFLGFIKKEYKRYGVSIYHYKIQEDFLKLLNQWEDHAPLKKYWKEITEFSKDKEGIRFTTSKINNSDHTREIPSIVIAERLYQNTVRIDYVKDSIKGVISRYGHRQKNMAESGVEYKGLYHTLRLIYEANDLYDLGRFEIPFNKERHKMLWDIKNGNVDKDYLFSIIDSEIQKLYVREKESVSNKIQVSHRIDKLDYTLKGRLSVFNAMFQ